MARLEILLDCDGVLADFVSATIEKHGQDMRHDDVNDWNYFEDWGITPSQFWEPLRGREFWRNLEPYAWAHELFDRLEEIGNVTILTSPSDDTCCASGKADWLWSVMGIRPGQTMIGSRKYLLGKKGALLIDDSDSNVGKFKSSGGEAILFPQPWNSSKLKDWEEVVVRAEEIATFHTV